jgi:RNA polymerase sigma-54 factor
MTPQLRLAIKLLQFSHQDVAAFIEEELERNPLLERDEDQTPAETADTPSPDTRPEHNEASDSATLGAADTLPEAAPLDTEWSDTYDVSSASDGGLGLMGRGGSSDFSGDDRGIEDLAEAPRSLRDHLGEQVRLGFPDPAERLIAGQFLALLDPAGRVGMTDDAIAEALGVPTTAVTLVRERMMRFDPTGMFALNLRQCLAVQLAEKNRLDPAMATLLDHLELVGKRDTRALIALCGVDAADIADMINEIKRLDPKPGASYDLAPVSLVVPDVLMRRAPDGGWLLEMNPETLPRLLVNEQFQSRLPPGAGRDAKMFMSEKLAAANWLVKSLQQRAETILKVATDIVRQQDGFFRHGIGHLRPLILRDVAEAVELHESTVSRVTANKYMATPRGLFELKYFFTTAINATGTGENHSAETVRHRIKQMVNAETENAILSDDAIVAALRREGVDIARRTVAKYRDALRIPSSVQRKREKAHTA